MPQSDLAVQWLLGGDAGIRWQTLRDLRWTRTGMPPSNQCLSIASCEVGSIIPISLLARRPRGSLSSASGTPCPRATNSEPPLPVSGLLSSWEKGEGSGRQQDDFRSRSGNGVNSFPDPGHQRHGARRAFFHQLVHQRLVGTRFSCIPNLVAQLVAHSLP